MKTTLFVLALCSCRIASAQFSTFREISKDVSNSIVEVADIDNDGYDDLVTISRGANQLTVYMNNGSGSFSIGQQLPLETINQQRMIVGDVNNDGWKDVVTIVESDVARLVVLGNTAGMLGITDTVYTAPFSSGNDDYDLFFCFTNYNQDAYPEIAVENQDVIRLKENVSGTFDEDVNLEQIYGFYPGWNRSFLQSIDMDGDGDEDLMNNLMAYDSFGQLYNVWLERTNTTYVKKFYYPNGQSVRFMATHFNVGSAIDYLMVNPNYGVLLFQDSILLANSLPIPLNTQSMNISAVDEIIPVDINNDGSMDVLVNGQEHLYALLNNGTNTSFTQDTIYTALGGGVPNNERFHYKVCDLDGDGWKDLAATDIYADDIFWLRNNGDMTFTQHLLDYNASEPTNVYPLDINGDGAKDILSCYYRKQGLHVFENQSVDVYKKNEFITMAYAGQSYSPSHLSQLDIDDDGDEDLIIANDNVSYFFWYENAPEHSLETEHTFTPAVSGAIRKILTEDMDNDGKKDFVFFTYTGVEVCFNLGGGAFASSVVVPVPSNQLPLWEGFIEDMNGDNLKDVVFVSGNMTHTAQYVRNLGNGALAPVVALPFAVTTMGDGKIYGGDVDNDGMIDIIAEYAGLKWYKNLGNDNFNTGISLPPQSTHIWKNLFVEDLDLDGDRDILVLDRTNMAENNIWTVKWYENNGSQSYTSHIIETGMLSPQGSIPAITGIMLEDLDDDGDLDILVAKDADKVGYYRNDAQAPYQIAGSLYIDENHNGLKDASEPGFDYEHVTLEPEGIVGFTDQEGNYFFSVAPGDYTVTFTALDTTIWQLVTDSLVYHVTVDAAHPLVDGRDFGFSPLSDSTIILSDIVSQPMSCNLDLVQHLHVRNSGGTRPSGIITYTCDTIVDITTVSPAPDSIADNRYYWHFDSLFYFSEFHAVITFETPGFTYMGDTLEFSLVTQTIDGAGQPEHTFSDTFSSVFTCAYDPNNKVPEPAGYLSDGFILASEEYLDFTINFQNTGTDTATNVVIHDQLSQYLDRESLEILASSDPMHAFMSENGLLTFEFNNIHLPDSNASEPDSKGYVKYRLWLMPGLAAGTVIDNQAGIYFDENPAVLTNTTTHTIFDCNWLRGVVVEESTLCTAGNTVIVPESPYISYAQWTIDSGTVFNAVHLEEMLGLGTHTIGMTVGNPLCSFDTTFLVTISETPVADLNTADTLEICSTQNLVLNSGSANSNWELGETIVSTDSLLHITASGTYILSVTNGFCVARDTVTAIVMDPVTAEIIGDAENFVSCDGSEVLLMSLSAIGNNWTFAETLIGTQDQQAAVLPGWYTLTIDGFVCPDAEDSVLVTAFSPYQATIGISDTMICEGTSAVLTSVQGQNAWYHDQQLLGTDSSLTIVSGGWYFLQFTDSACPATEDSVFIEVEVVPVGPFISYADSTLHVDHPAVSSVEWYKAGELISVADSVAASSPGTYIALLTFDNGCSSADTFLLSFAGISDQYGRQLMVYPVPVQEELTIRGLEESGRIAVVNELGQTVVSASFFTETMTIDIHTLASGVYYVIVLPADAAKKIQQLKFIKE